MKNKLIEIKNIISYCLGYFLGLVSGITVSIITVLVLFPFYYIKYILGKGLKPLIKRSSRKKEIEISKL